MKKIILVLIVGVILLGGCAQEITYEEELPDEKYSWENQGNGVWVRNDIECGDAYYCPDNCYENTNVIVPFKNEMMNVWEDCEWNEDIIQERETDTGVKVLCFTQGCVPQYNCEVVCPAG